MSRSTRLAVGCLYAVAGAALLTGAWWWGHLGGWGADAECRHDVAACPDVGPALPATPLMWALTLGGTAVVALLAWLVRPSDSVVRVGWAVVVGAAVGIANWQQPIWAVVAGVGVAGVLAVPRAPSRHEVETPALR
jgi:hypothetical protein